MNIKKIKLSLLMLLCFTSATLKSQKQDIIEYATYLKELDHNNIDIDYRQFRISYIYSQQFKKKESSDYKNLKKKVNEYIKKNKDIEVIDACQKMLAIDYTSMFAHKHLQNAAKSIGCSVLYKKHHDIEFRLLKSIIHNSDGASCDTSWEVVQLEEQFFILDMLEVKLKKHEIDEQCNKVEIKDGDETETYYFDVYYVYEKGEL